MKKSLVAIAVVLITASLSACGDSWDTGATPTQNNSLARTQVERFLKDVQTKNTADLGGFLAPNFQNLRTDGTKANKQTYIPNLPTLRSYRLGTVNGLEYSDTLTVTWMAALDFTVDGKRYVGTANPFVSVFIKRDGEWRMLVNGNFTHPPK